ncbi:MAG: [ribosomal protein S18]-alanine N-acetyltransferase [Eubacteriaceae bacterium]|nr:[ribosomal protein S18]-alanine N-acetyltransferase [Eubacteriaceae bacterium]MDK2936062.1 [ribosomal protein S18]-alanine N-acetyltransferase [Eubacteriaceae bacterium]MDK2960892.1 [ribosomal protein S18]-alanine N-acetyltransferase [Eubacteriaceae bacterium]
MLIRKMNASDIEAVFKIDQDCFNHNWTLDSYQNEINNLLATYVVAENDATVIGFGGYWRVIDEAQITNIGILKPFRHAGIGEMILNKLCSLAVLEGCDRMTLEVREDNLPAIAFYKKHRFVQEGIRRHYYGQDQHGLIMWRYNLEN